MESAERYGSALRRRLRSADRLSDAAMRLGSRRVKTPLSSVSASLCSVTWRDQRRPPRRLVAGRLGDLLARLGLLDLRLRVFRRFDAVAFFAMRYEYAIQRPSEGLSTIT